MMRRMYWFVVLLLLLSLPALACSVFGSDEAEATAVPEAAPVVEESAPEVTAVPPTAESAAEPAAEPTVAEETTTEPAVPESALSLNTIEELPFNSYRITMVLEVTGKKEDGQEVTQSMNSEFTVSNDPKIMNIAMNFSGIDETIGSESIEMAQVDGTSYMVIPEMGCITTSGGDILEENPFADMMAPDQFLNDMNNAKYEGEETINGIATRHYSFDQSAMTGTDLTDVNAAEGHVYIAQDGDYLVRLTLDANGNIDLFDEGLVEDSQMHIEINLTDIDVPVEAAIPAACAAEDGSVGSVNSEFPMLEDATEITSFAGVLSYQTVTATEDVLAFYDDALTNEGWAKDEEGSFVAGSSAMVNYTREGVSLSVTISPNENGNGNYVILLSDAGE
ncbi:MAG: hypothetical protein H6667_06410 [Ardenticatenaceae bacterium]|nr:hypothetical protein [Ardenticatenaceae bacterium]MCB9442813.1 hypothetical protein [Ardenticatenaceae bacterium]